MQRRPAWTGYLVGLMHLEGISAKELAREAGWGEKYLSAVLCGRRQPAGAEQKVMEAYARLSLKMDRRPHGLGDDLKALLEQYRETDPEYARRLGRYLGFKDE